MNEFPVIMNDAIRVHHLEPPTEYPVHVVLDTDTFNEVDDQFALAYALLAEDKILLEAVHAAPFHNSRSKGPEDGMLKSYNEIVRITEKIMPIPDDFIFRGSPCWMTKYGPINSPAVEDLVDRALGADDYVLYVVTIGAPTNVASAIALEPSIVNNMAVIWLGGNEHTWHTGREFNLYQDIEASRVLFNSGVPLLQIPCLNVAEQLRVSLPFLKEYLAGKSDLGDYLYNIVRRYTKDPFCWSKVIWDISAIAWLVNPNWFTSKLVHSPILNDNFTYSQDGSRHLMRVVTHINRDPIFKDLFTRINALGYKDRKN